MLTFRLIARLNIRNEHLIQPIRSEGVRRVGDPAEFAKRYDAQGVDELLYCDRVSSLYRRNSLGDLAQRTAEECFCPLTITGGVGDVAEGRRLLARGADKLGLNTAAVGDPRLLSRLAESFGSQAVVLQLDAKRKGAGWTVFTHGGRQPTGLDAIKWAGEAVARGAGEILVTSIDREGTRTGFDLGLLRQLVSLPVPVIAAGGAGALSHILEAAETGVSGVALATVLHYNELSLDEIRRALETAGVEIRWPINGPLKTHNMRLPDPRNNSCIG